MVYLGQVEPDLFKSDANRLMAGGVAFELALVVGLQPAR